MNNVPTEKEISRLMAHLARLSNAKRSKEWYRKFAAKGLKKRRENKAKRGVNNSS